MSIVVFILVLAVLIFSHELGHFLAAKRYGIKVEEFGLGFPPRIIGKRWGETLYSLNWLPLGGFVKIHGENPNETPDANLDQTRSLINQPRHKQAVVLAAGVFFNLLLAWLLLSLGLVAGLPASSNFNPDSAVPARLIITSVVADSPAARAGLQTGDQIVSLRSGDGAAALTPAGIQQFVAAHQGDDLALTFDRRPAGPQTITVRPSPTIGIAMDTVVITRLPVWRAISAGGWLTLKLTGLTILGFGHLIVEAFQGAPVLNQITGPVGLAGIVGDASSLGLVYLLSITAFISINLAVINLVPFPALDGGRLLFLLIEKIKGSRLRPAIANWLNLIGFALLILLMLVVTYGDIVRLLK